MRKNSYASRRESLRIKSGFHRSNGDNPSPATLKGRDRIVRAGLYLKGYGYLRQDMRRINHSKIFVTTEKIEGQSSKLLVLKITNKDKKNMPYEHLTLKRIDAIL